MVGDLLTKGGNIPFRSERQRKWMHINKPKIAKRWDKKYGGRIISKHGKRRKK